jgi:hypothetical protein
MSDHFKTSNILKRAEMCVPTTNHKALVPLRCKSLRPRNLMRPSFNLSFERGTLGEDVSFLKRKLIERGLSPSSRGEPLSFWVCLRLADLNQPKSNPL